MKRYYVRPVGRGYGETVYPGNLMSLADARKELSSVARAEAKQARRYFGTAVIHRQDQNSITITARQDIQSALWCHFAVCIW